MSNVEARFRGTDVTFYPAGDVEVVSSLLESRAAIVPRLTGELLARCRGFRSLDEHALELCRTAGLAASRAEAIRRRLDSLREAGFLTRYDDLLRRCGAGRDAPEAPAAIATLGIPTCDRVEVLARGLRSYMANARDHGRDVEFVLADDSRHAVSRRANAANLAALAYEHGMRASLAGEPEREAFAAALSRETGVALETVRFALVNPEGLPNSVGACRNALLLHTVGEPLVQADDDTICNLAPALNARPGLSLWSSGDPTESFCFASADEARAAVRFEPRDYLGLYETVLGRSVAGVLAERGADQEVDLESVLAAFVKRLEHGECRVVTAALGIVGDSGLGSSDRYFLFDGPSRERLRDAGEAYRRAFESRQLARAAPRTTLAESGPCMGLALGLDNRGLLPPFLPVLRAQDGVFGTVRRLCLPSTTAAYLPWLVEHAPPGDRRATVEQALRPAGRTRLADLLLSLMGDLEPAGATDPAGRLEALGRHLLELGSWPLADYVARCRRDVTARAAEVQALIERAAARGLDGDGCWRHDVAVYARALVERAASADAPAEFLDEGLSPEDAARRGQRLVALYGELLRCWPALVAGSRELRRRGVQLAQPVV
jgi:hypothetical protein